MNMFAVAVYIICSNTICKGEDVFVTRVVPSSLVCDSLCTYTTRCGSYTWDAATRSCHLHTRADTETDTTPHAMYGEETLGMDCHARLCGENEVCVQVEAGRNYKCLTSTATTTTTSTTTTQPTTPSSTTTKTPTTTTTTTTTPLSTITKTPTTTTTTTTTPSPTTTTTTTPLPTTTKTPSITTTTTTTPSPTTTKTPPITTTTTKSPSPNTTTTTTPSSTTTKTPPTTTTTTTSPNTTTTTTPSPTTTKTPPPTSTTATTPCPTTIIQSKVPHIYVGCHQDQPSRVLPRGKMSDKTHLTIETCKLHCHGRNYTYFGTEVGRQCFCGNVIKPGYPKKPDAECHMQCPGDRSTSCGGMWRISIYKII